MLHNPSQNTTYNLHTPSYAGDLLAVISAMKMEMSITAPKDGVIKSMEIEKGMKLQGDDLLMTIE